MSGEHLRIEVNHLTKRYGPVTAVRDLTFTVEPGVVTGFLGPNGAGKTTTLRMLTGLVSPTSGTATIGGLTYRRLPHPTRTVGAVFDTVAFHPTHTARDHLRVYAALGGHPDTRVDHLLDELGLTTAAHRHTRTFSTGMRQRLNLATALLGDPRVLLLDEPSNGLDPEGIAWLRDFLRTLADDGRTILVSSHVLGEIGPLAQNVVVIRHGELLACGPWSQLTGPPTVMVGSPHTDALVAALTGTRTERTGPDRIRVHGLTAPAIADLAARHSLRVHELTTEVGGLEQLFLRLTAPTGQKDTR
ncbi:ATP-binding cassette domain-containing protein [Micromonospora sp. NPDC047548]|uniref:ABC transporter ATP-binding protein n=1 Tax=Micromonospora sp. NPDC047548 TaxID=3155624 RepID=UPI0033EC10D3